MEDDTPIWREEVTLSRPDGQGGIFGQHTAAPARVDKKTKLAVSNDSLEETLSLTDVPLCEECEPEDILADPTLTRYSKTVRQLIIEAKSPEHLFNHHPHNPMC